MRRKNGSIIARKKIRNTYPGIVKLDHSTKKEEIRILNFSLVLRKARILEPDQNILILDNQKKFHLKVNHNEVLQQNHLIAVLEDESYTTKTGGIVTYNLEKKFATKKRKGTGKLFSGSLYWIAEETHSIKNNILCLY